MKPVLFLLPHGFADPAQGPGLFVCPDCMAVEGLLASFPKLREELDVREAPFARPRQEIIDLVGDQHQGCPVLVLGGGQFRTGFAAIGLELSLRYGTPRPH